MHKFRDLIVWQKAMELAKEVYPLTRRFPYTEQKGMISQIQRAVVSIPANIAEGAGRKTPKDFAHFLSQANGSAYEVETLLELALSQDYISQEEFDNTINKIEEIEKMLYTMSNSLNPVEKNPNTKY